jgi:Secretion system C-terminal sorting domain
MMKKLTLTAIYIFTCLFSRAQTTSTAQWLRHACVESFSGSIFGDAIASDNLGNSYNAGFLNTVTIYMDTMARPVFPHKNYLNKYNAAGERLWTKSFGGTSPNTFVQITRMKCDDAGNVYMCGTLSGATSTETFSFGTTVYERNGGFIVKFDPNGNEVWSIVESSLGFPGERHITFNDMDIANNKIYLCGYTSFGTFNWGALNFTGNNPQNAFITQVDDNGNILLAEFIDPNTTCEAWGIAVSKLTNSVFIVGQQIDATGMNIDGHTLSLIAGATNSFILKMDNTFTAQWLKGGVTYLNPAAVVGTGVKCLKQVELDKFDNLYMIGNGNGDLTSFGSLSFIHNTTTNFMQDVYLLKYTSSGTEQWLKFGHSASNDVVNDLVVDQWGDAIIAVGSGSNTFSGFIFDTNTLPTGTLTFSGLVKYAPNGNLIYTKSFHENQFFRKMSMGNDSTFFVTGTGLQYAFPFDTITTVTSCENPGGSGANSGKMIISKFNDPTYIIGRNMVTILPVSILSVKAYQQNSGINVEWVTATEINVSSYEVEKATDGLQFVTIGNVPARNNNGGANTNYTYFDANPSVGNNYYRIKSVDNDGRTKYTQVINVKIGTGKNIFTVAPNPVQGNTINLQLQGVDKGLLVLTMYNNGGQQVFSKFINHAGGSATQTINIGNIAKGIYQLHITGASSSRTVKTVLIQ